MALQALQQTFRAAVAWKLYLILNVSPPINPWPSPWRYSLYIVHTPPATPSASTIFIHRAATQLVALHHCSTAYTNGPTALLHPEPTLSRTMPKFARASAMHTSTKFPTRDANAYPCCAREETCRGALSESCTRRESAWEATRLR